MVRLEVGSWLGLDAACLQQDGEQGEEDSQAEAVPEQGVGCFRLSEAGEGEKWREWGMKGTVEGLLRDARKEMEEGAIYGELGDRFQRRMDDAMRKTISLVKKAECGVVGHPTVETKVRSRRKEPFSEQLRAKSERLRELQRLLHRERTRGKHVVRSYGMWVEKRFGWNGLGTADSEGR